MRTAWLFSGQGAQAVGMGKDLVERHPMAAAVFQEADAVLGWSVSELCFAGPAEKLTESRFCQPAIYTMSSACLAAFRAAFPEILPTGVAGLSLGEFAALHAAGVFSFADGLRLVARRGELMDQCCCDNPGGMASVLGADPDLVREVCAACGIDVANYNCPGQVVISGTKDGVAAAVEQLRARGVRKLIPLNVAGAYHSRLMRPAGEAFSAVLDGVALQVPTVPAAQNYPGACVADIDEIRANLVAQVAGSVRWEECIAALARAGADAFVEFGPGNIVSGLARRCAPAAAVFSINGADALAGFTPPPAA
jgi:[acyl-carrier-protein] S-malonyltransferase